MQFALIGTIWIDPVDPEQIHTLAIDLRNFALVVLVAGELCGIHVYLDRHPERVEVIRQTIRERFEE